MDDPSVAEIHRKTVANGFWNYEVEQEMQEQNMKDFSFVRTCDREKFMVAINEMQAATIYDHKDCSEECKLRGMLCYNCAKIKHSICTLGTYYVDAKINIQCVLEHSYCKLLLP